MGNPESQTARSVRWRPPLDIALAVTSLFISLATLLLTSPLIIGLFFAPALNLKEWPGDDDDRTYELSNDGWTTAHNVQIDFDTFVGVKAAHLRPEIGTAVPGASGDNYRISIPALAPREKVLVSFDLEPQERSGLADFFGNIGAYSLRSDEGSGRITQAAPASNR